MLKFNFENAFMHFKRTGAPRGFVWKYALAYTLVSIAFIVLLGILFGGAYTAMMQAALTGDADTINSAVSPGMIGLMYLVLLPISLLLYAVFESSYLRRYMRLDTFKLKLGSDELKVFVVLLIWAAFVIVVGVVFSFLVGVVAGVIGSPVVAFLLGLAAFVGFGYLAARFSPAAAMTIRDRQIRFASAWTATKGKGWGLLGAYAVWFILGVVAYFVVILIMASIMGLGAAGADPAALQSGSMLAMLGIGGIIMYLLILAAYACFMYIWAGPAALAAKTDPNYAGIEQNAVFD